MAPSVLLTYGFYFQIKPPIQSDLSFPFSRPETQEVLWRTVWSRAGAGSAHWNWAASQVCDSRRKLAVLEKIKSLWLPSKCQQAFYFPVSTLPEGADFLILFYFAGSLVIVVWDHVDTVKPWKLKTCIKVDIKEEFKKGKERGVGIWGLRSHFKGKWLQERESEATMLNYFSVPALSLCLLEHLQVLQRLKLLEGNSVKNNRKIISL